MEWLWRACLVWIQRGVSDGYSLTRGWTPPYPETTGYIIPTLFNYAKLSGDERFAKMAVELANWEIEVQFDSGAVISGMLDVSVPLAEARRRADPAVFNTGQVIQGWVRAYQETHNVQYIDAAKKAGEWILSMQDGDGVWRRGDSPLVRSDLRVYHARVAWPLLELWQSIGDERYKTAAIKNLDWAQGQQRSNGWYQNCSFDERPPLTHTIGYTIEGMFESGVLLQAEKYKNSARFAAEALMHAFDHDHYIYGTYNADWKSADAYSCLVGDAQLAVCWLRIFEETKDKKFLNAAVKLMKFLKRTQNMRSSCGGIRGGIKGSQPIWGAYAPHYYPNWAAKFFADALMLEEKLIHI
jgi:hypothetical protein